MRAVSLARTSSVRLFAVFAPFLDDCATRGEGAGRMRGAPVRTGWIVGLAVVGLLAAGAAPAAAADTVPPATVPTITAPVDAARVAGDVTLTATTTNPSDTPSVQFFVDGT